MTTYKLLQDAVGDVNNESDASIFIKDTDVVTIPNLRATLGTSLFNEIPVGDVNGVNDTFTLTHLEQGEGLQLFCNGLIQQVFTDYTFTDNIITFTPGNIPRTGDRLFATYSF